MGIQRSSRVKPNMRNLRHYFPPMLRRPTVRRPYASKYGDQAYVKMQQVLPLYPYDGRIIQYMRQDGTGPDLVTSYLINVPEYVPFSKVYAFFEVVGMKMDVVVNPKSGVASLQMYGGMVPNFNFDQLEPETALTNEQLADMPLQVTCNVQGGRSCLYYAFSKDLKKQGAQYAASTMDPGYYPSQQNGMLVLNGSFVGDAPFEGALVGSVKLTWYVRFTSRTKKPAEVLAVPADPTFELTV